MTGKSYTIPLQKRNLITLPKEVREKLEIYEGDMLDLRVEDNKIIIEPYRLVPASQAYFWSKETQANMLEAQEDLNSGRVRKFNSIQDFAEGIEDD